MVYKTLLLKIDQQERYHQLLFLNSGPVALLRLKDTWKGALISVDSLKTTLLQIFFLYFYNGIIFGGTYIRVDDIWNHFCVSILLGYMRGAYFPGFTVLKQNHCRFFFKVASSMYAIQTYLEPSQTSTMEIFCSIS